MLVLVVGGEGGEAIRLGSWKDHYGVLVSWFLLCQMSTSSIDSGEVTLVEGRKQRPPSWGGNVPGIDSMPV